VITPGTVFLYDVGQAIRVYIKNRLANHRLWKNLTVVFSDASCCGEGEHKIMDFIRQQRASLTYDPNQHHCIYGADADLIMLGLATH
jgi:5'-3' exoribonuclease 2